MIPRRYDLATVAASVPVGRVMAAVSMTLAVVIPRRYDAASVPVGRVMAAVSMTFVVVVIPRRYDLVPT